ncbi:aminoglycoside phosphotransferase family protein [Streptomyces phaeochromogenes]|uniref:Aminoglycoside phosphotransferase family protein n=1 Tax=Streptomyces phaeochromogenes TaxID=1923 RepID=A0ABZ1H871_STRPH|nr:aminoglycoside phosphotransferase family protein [Streptomyces phaeochromogenes]MCX5601015.1 aminoglycoside phosphotransferase family protein [Streptomyces phaeochromogenes]WRZ29030.1 aminoglycoside phosphotransferase family protein [Streptomyces phaeochromogenes]WSD14730.1 aminoglycoside phosphotransferase family protein [Streptomyces phaeochromogenes]WSJ08423.1 aminoglycoside phosphotransferase family protein [Streptomyces phaeochromogenes]WSS93295.1 aminoglycoside phosphotransferase fami
MAFEPPRRLVKALGEAAPSGDDWLEKLPEAAQQAVALRELTVERVQVPGGRSSLVVLVRLPDDTPAVLKLAPGRARPESERAALAHWDGLGAVRLLEPAGAEGVLLLERLHPDVSVRSLAEAKSMLEAAGALRRLWVEPPAGPVFETVAERTGRQAEAMRAGADAEAAPLVDAALAVRDELLASPPESRLLHGTFRQSKVLAGERSPWLAVGPDPVVGECAFDLARLVRDRVEDVIASPSGSAITRRRVKRLAESLDLDQERVRGWTLFRAVESGVRARRVGRSQDAELLLEFASWL